MRIRSSLAASLFLLLSSVAIAQDVMKYGLKHLRVLAEDDKVRVLKFTPKKGDKTPIHSHPATVVYVVKGGKVKTTAADGTTREVEMKTGDTLIRPPVTHSDEALDDLEMVIVELKK